MSLRRPKSSGRSRIGPGLMERLQVAAAAGTVPEGAGEEGVPVQAAELADASAIEADRAVPHDLLEGGGLLDEEPPRRFQAVEDGLEILPQTQPENA